MKKIFSILVALVVALDVSGQGGISGGGAPIFGGPQSSAQSSGVTTVIEANATTESIQAAFDRGGKIVFPAFGTITNISNIRMTNVVDIEGNGCMLVAAPGLTNFMIDSATNLNYKLMRIDGLRLNGGIFSNYNSSTYFIRQDGNVQLYFNNFWSNRGGMRVNSANGGYIRNCEFFGWPGAALYIGNTVSNLAFQRPRMVISGNTCYSNFLGIGLIGANSESAGYNAPHASFWTPSLAEYQLLHNNITFRNYIGISAPPGNGQVLGCQMTEDFIGLFLGGADNGTHGVYSENLINHTIGYAIWCERANNGGEIRNNCILAGGPVVVRDCFEFNFENNRIGATDLLFTNSTGVIRNNTYDGAWGVDVITNYSADVLVSGNQAKQHTGNTDNSVISLLEQRGMSVGARIILSNLPAGQVPNSTYANGSIIVGTNLLFFRTNDIWRYIPSH